MLEEPFTGHGYNTISSHSLFLGAGLIGGLPYMILWMALFWALARRSIRLWTRDRDHPGRGPLNVGLAISMTYACIQNLLDPMLYAVNYGLVFWFLRGIESVLLKTGDETFV
jgi:hypothetical protein